MRKRTLRSAESAEAVEPLGLSVSELERQAQGWLLDCEIRQLSSNTLDLRRVITGKLLWYLREQGHTHCDGVAVRAFLAYLANGHKQEGGRWGNGQLTRAPRPKTIKLYYDDLAAMFRFLVGQGVVVKNPMEGISKPVVRQDQVQPFTGEQVQALLSAAKRSENPRRNEAIILFLLDTGARASEVCSLKVGDVDLTQKRCSVAGKGNKKRQICFGPTTARALLKYLSEAPRPEDAGLFLSDKGGSAGEGLTRVGLRLLFVRLGKVAKLSGVRCSPHTFRHTFAVNFLRRGGNVFTLKELLGHTALHMVNRYVALAQADLDAQHRLYSPVEGLLGGKAKR